MEKERGITIKNVDGNTVYCGLDTGLPEKIRIAWNRGKRKPEPDQDGVLWCNCKYPRLIPNIGRGQAFCIKCKTPWYH